MSTILKALKKLETDAPKPVGSSFMVRSMGARKPTGITLKPVQMIIAAVLTGLCVIMVSVAGWLSPGKLSDPHDEKALHPAVLPKPASADPAHDCALNEKAKSRAASSSSTPATLPETVTVPSGALLSVALKPPPAETRPLDQPANHDMVKNISQPPVPAHAQSSPDSAGSHTEPRSDTSPVIAEKTAEETGLKIEAIAWSEAPERRLAVINGHILKEDDVIDAVHIQRIGMEEVVFNDGTNMWKIIFRID